jgi:hypothetical protein
MKMVDLQLFASVQGLPYPVSIIQLGMLQLLKYQSIIYNLPKKLNTLLSSISKYFRTDFQRFSDVKPYNIYVLISVFEFEEMRIAVSVILCAHPKPFEIIGLQFPCKLQSDPLNKTILRCLNKILDIYFI